MEGNAVPAASAVETGTLQQGDLVSGLAVAVTGLGAVPQLPASEQTPAADAGEVWTVTFMAPAGWYAICSQDCDLTSDDAGEPTVTVAPVLWLPADRWASLSADSYTSRFFAIPDVLDGAPEGHAPAVDLAWLTSVAKGSLSNDPITVCRPLTGPQQRRFAAWVGWRFARVPFPDDVVRCVLDPAYRVRARLMSRYVAARERGDTPPIEVRAAGACGAWYARLLGPNVTLLGRLTAERLTDAGFVDADGDELLEELERGRVKLETQIRKRMQRDAPNSGFGVKVLLRTFDQLRASDLDVFSMLMR